jgi:hypothetical protein
VRRGTGHEKTTGNKNKLNLDTGSYRVIRDSDAHSLYNINEAINFIELPFFTATEIIKLLKK